MFYQGKSDAKSDCFMSSVQVCPRFADGSAFAVVSVVMRLITKAANDGHAPASIPASTVVELEDELELVLEPPASPELELSELELEFEFELEYEFELVPDVELLELVELLPLVLVELEPPSGSDVGLLLLQPIAATHAIASAATTL